MFINIASSHVKIMSFLAGVKKGNEQFVSNLEVFPIQLT
jgi:hypothetical protein